MLRTMKIGTALSIAILALSPSASVAEDGLLRNGLQPAIAKLLVLPGNINPTGMTDPDSLTSEVNFSTTYEGSSSHSGASSQSGRTDIFEYGMLRLALEGSIKRKPLKIKRKVKASKKTPPKIAKYSSRKRNLKKYAPLMLGVYR